MAQTNSTKQKKILATFLSKLSTFQAAINNDSMPSQCNRSTGSCILTRNPSIKATKFCFVFFIQSKSLILKSIRHRFCDIKADRENTTWAKTLSVFSLSFHFGAFSFLCAVKLQQSAAICFEAFRRLQLPSFHSFTMGRCTSVFRGTYKHNERKHCNASLSKKMKIKFYWKWSIFLYL